MRKLLLTLALTLATACGPSHVALAADVTPSHTMFWMNVNGDATADAERISTDLGYIRGHAVDLGVLAELNPVEAHDFVVDAGSQYGLVYSGDPAYKNNGNGVFYDRTVWRLIGHESVWTYSWANERVITVVPFLQDHAGAVVAVFPLHNPWSFAAADAADMRIEARTALAIRGYHPSWRVVVAGDFNMTATARQAMTGYGLHSPDTSWTPVDQAFTVGMTTSGYRYVATSATDHRFSYQFQF